MAYDITMCPGDACPRRERCYRYLAQPDARQDWFTTPPYDPRADACAAYWDVATVMPTAEQIRGRAYFVWVAAGRPEGCADAHWAHAERELTDAARARLRR